MATRKSISVTILSALVACLAASAMDARAYASHSYGPRQKLEPYAQFLADLADRPGRVIYTPYPVSATRGLVRAFVHVGDGTAVLSRTDLVVDAKMPIVVRRAYDSARTRSGDFGAGWRLTVGEELEQQPNGRLLYTYGNGARLDLDARGRITSVALAYLTDVVDARTSTASIEIRTRTGLTKRFDRAGTRFRLASVRDAYGNGLQFHHASGGRLERISASSGAWVQLFRDAHGRVTRVTDWNARSVSYAYDAGGLLIKVTDPGSHEWHYAYDTAGRLQKTTMPSGASEVSFEYDKGGRVTRSGVNGLHHRFDYEGSHTVVTDDKGLATTYSASSSGLTVAVANSLGTNTLLGLDANGLPRNLARNGERIVDFAASAKGEVASQQAVFRSPADGHVYRIRYDRLGRVLGASSDRPGYGYEVTRYGPGVIAERIAHADASEEAVQFDGGGELTTFRARNGRDLSFRRQGENWKVENTAGHQLELKFNKLGRLYEARTPGGAVLEFGYNDVGLRERTRTSYGALVRYQYDASGSLFHSQVSDGGTARPAYTYVLSPGQRVDAVASNGATQAHFLYDDKGLLKAVRSYADGGLSFEYDALHRLRRVERTGEQPLEYSYDAGEPDIIRQLTVRALPAYNQQREISDFGSRFDIVLTRVKPAALGFFTYDETTDELTLAADPVAWNPGSFMSRSIAALKLETVLGEDPRAIPGFVMPSNRLFVPAEYWSVNCCICLCSDPDFECYVP